MLEKIIRWSLSNRIVVLLGSAAWIAIGLWSVSNLGFDAFPDTTPVQVQINAQAPSLVPEEIERQITFPIELAISGLSGLQEVRSVSQFGLASVVVTFNDSIGIYFARQMINERLSSVQMPPGIDRPQMGPVATGLGEVLHYFVTSPTRDLTELRTIHDWVIKPGMRSTPGAAEINSWGGFEKQYQVRVDPGRLLKHDLTFQQVMDAVVANNLNVGGGRIHRDAAGEKLLVHGVARTIDVEQISNIMVSSEKGVPIRVRDVADVAIGHELRRGVVTANGTGEVVLGLGFMLMGENSYAVTHRLKDRLHEMAEQAPEGVDLRIVYDRTELVDNVINTVRKNLFEGALLVIAILYVFLGSLRAGLIVASAIPMSMLFAFSGMLQAGIAGTLLSLGAIDFGVVVDSSVVVLENIVHKLAHHPREGRRRLILIGDAAIEVRQPAVFGQLIIMIVYLPILSLEGVEGKMFRPMAWTVIFVLIGSLIVSLTLMPVLASYLLPRNLSTKEPFLVRLATWLYRPLLRVCLGAPILFLGVAGVVLAIAAGMASRMGTEFVPKLSEGAIVIGLARAPGYEYDEAARIELGLQSLLREKFPDEIADIWSRLGAPEVATDAGDTEMSDMFVILTPRERWKKAHTQADLVTLMEKEMVHIPGLTFWFTQPIEQRINEMVSGVRADIALKLFGDDFETLVTKGRELEKVLRSVPGAADVTTEQVSGQPIMRLQLRQDILARYGVPAKDVLDVIESIGGKSAGEIVEGQLRFPLAFRLPESFTKNPESVGSIVVRTADGERLPLSRLANISVEAGPRMIPREWSKRRITIQCNVRGRDIGSFVADAQAKVAEAVELPPGYRIDWGGQFENMRRAQARLAIVVPVALGLIVGLLYFTYRTARDTLFVFASVPFACVGGIFALAMRDLPISISAAVGFITLSGVSVLNSMVIVSSILNLLQTGKPAQQAVAEATMQKLSTVIMTSLVASVGFLPMMLSTGVGAEVQRPLATVVVGGVLSSTVMTLFLLPPLYKLALRKGNPYAVTPTQA